MSFKLQGASFFGKGCYSKTGCDQIDKTCKAFGNATNCKLNCCDKDLCNSSPTQVLEDYKDDDDKDYKDDDDKDYKDDDDK